MDLGKRFRKDNTIVPSEKLKKQLEEMKQKEKELVAKMEKQEAEEKKQRELEAEKKLLEDEKKRKEHLEAEVAKVKAKENKLAELQKKQKSQEQQKKLKNIIMTSVNSKSKPEHPSGCMCGRCVKMRKKLRTPKGERPIEKLIKLFNKSKPKQTQKSKQEKPKSEKVEAIDAKVHPSKYTDITVLGVRLAVGISFIVHGLSKMDGDGQMFIGMLNSWGLPAELAFPIALAELVAGILISVGFLTRISSALIGVIMLGAIFHVKGAASLIGQGGVELDLIILSIVALLGMFGPGKFSVANIGIKGMIFDRKLQ